MEPSIQQYTKFIDNGPGIPNEIMSGFSNGINKENGSGLGLTIAQDIIRIHGGGIFIKSRKNCFFNTNSNKSWRKGV